MRVAGREARRSEHPLQSNEGGSMLKRLAAIVAALTVVVLAAASVGSAVNPPPWPPESGSNPIDYPAVPCPACAALYGQPYGWLIGPEDIIECWNCDGTGLVPNPDYIPWGGTWPVPPEEETDPPAEASPFSWIAPWVAPDPPACPAWEPPVVDLSLLAWF
jgi:hypothetical protein